MCVVYSHARCFDRCVHYVCEFILAYVFLGMPPWMALRKVIADEHGIDPTGTLDHVL